MTLAKRFNTSLFMSGTPADYQKAISKNHETKTDCPLHVAVSNKWVCKPVLNLVKASSECMPDIIRHIVDSEKKKSESDKFNFGIRILANMKSIEDCHSCIKELKRDISFGNTNTIVIHSDKKIKNENNESGYDILKSEINGEEIRDNKKIIEVFGEIDDGRKFKDEPIIVFQVDMLSEGVNIRCFNAVIIQSNSAVKQMQQIGRALRDIDVDGHHKKDDGHASIYAIIENSDEVINLLTNLSENGLTAECFTWGKSLVECTGGTQAVDEDEPSEAGGLKWIEIDDVEISEYTIKWGSYKAQSKIRDISGTTDLKIDDYAKIEAFLDKMGGISFEDFTKKKNNLAFEKNKKTMAHAKKLHDIRKKAEDAKAEIDKKIAVAPSKKEVEKLEKKKVEIDAKAKKEEIKENNSYNLQNRRLLQKLYAFVNEYLNRSINQKNANERNRLAWLNMVFQSNSDLSDLWVKLTDKYQELKEIYVKND